MSLCSDLRLVGDTDYLAVLAKLAQQLADNFGGAAANTDIDFIKYHAWNMCNLRRDDLNSETYPGKLPARGDLLNSLGFLPFIGENAEADFFISIAAASIYKCGF